MVNNWYIIVLIAFVVGGYAAWQHRIVITDTAKKLFGGGKDNGPGKPL
jgi:hypothetical protein